MSRIKIRHPSKHRMQLASREAQTEGPMSNGEDKASSVGSLAEKVTEMSSASSNVFPSHNAEDVSFH